MLGKADAVSSGGTLSHEALDDERVAAELGSLRIERDTKRGAPAAARRRIGPLLIKLIAGIGACGLLAGAGHWLFQNGRAEIFPAEVELGSVTLMSPAQNDVTVVASGYVYTRKKATVAPKAAGRLLKLYVDEGDAVTTNQLLAELDGADGLARLAQVQADVAAAHARVERAKADLAGAMAVLAREDELARRGAGTPSSRQDAELKVMAMKAGIGAASAEVKAIEARQRVVAVDLENTKLKAPFDATVVRKLAEIGEMVSPQGDGVVLLASLDDLEVQADVTESNYGKIKVGAPAEILLDAFPDRRFRGEVREVRQQVERAKGSVTVKVRFADSVAGVLPDMAAKVSVLSRALSSADMEAAPRVVVPAGAITDRDGRKVVFVFENDHVREMPVKLASGEIGGFVEIKSGPVPGSRLVLRPSRGLREGAGIRQKKN